MRRPSRVKANVVASEVVHSSWRTTPPLRSLEKVVDLVVGQGLGAWGLPATTLVYLRVQGSTPLARSTSVMSEK